MFPAGREAIGTGVETKREGSVRDSYATAECDGAVAYGSWDICGAAGYFGEVS